MSHANEAQQDQQAQHTGPSRRRVIGGAATLAVAATTLPTGIASAAPDRSSPPTSPAGKDKRPG